MKAMKQVAVMITMIVLGTTNVDAQIYGDYRLHIDVTSNTGAHNSIIYFDDEVSWDPNLFPTYGWDACCDANSFGVGAGQPEIFTQVVEPPTPPVNYKLSRNALPHLIEPIDVPFGFISQALAEYTFKFTELYTLPTGTTVELEDLAQNLTQDLLADSTYVTWGAPSDDEERFIIHFNPSNITGISNEDRARDIKLNRVSNYLEVEGVNDLEFKQLRLFDIQGRLLFGTSTPRSKKIIKIDLSGIGSSVLLLSVQTEQGYLINLKVGV